MEMSFNELGHNNPADNHISKSLMKNLEEEKRHDNKQNPQSKSMNTSMLQSKEQDFSEVEYMNSGIKIDQSVALNFDNLLKIDEKFTQLMYSVKQHKTGSIS